MESTYQELKRKGIILCRVTDSKTYAKGGFMNGSKLAQESILMQYGYNVSQTVGLSARQRQKILAVMIDNKVLSKSEIISILISLSGNMDREIIWELQFLSGKMIVNL